MNSQTTWWNRACGGRDVIAIALPLVISMMSFTVMQFCDRLFLTWNSRLDLAAVVPAGALSWTCVSLPLGIAMFATTFVAQYDGAKQTSQIGGIVWQAIWIGVVCVPAYIVLGFFAELFFAQSGHSAELIWRETDYFRALSYSCGAIVINASISSFYIGREKTKVIMVVNIIAAIINVGLDYVMIFGVSVNGTAVLQAGGIAGAGWATTIAIWTKTAILGGLFLSGENRRRFNTLHAWRANSEKMRRLLRFGLPNGFQFCIEGVAITVFILIIARISDTASAATALAFSINMIVFVPIFGLGMAVTTLVGQQLGKQRPELASRATWTSLAIGLAYTSVFASLYLLFPHVFLAAHQTNATDFSDIQEMAIILLIFVAAYCLFDTVQLVFVSAIKGAGDTMFVVMTTVVSSAIFLWVGFQGSGQIIEVDDKIYWWWYCLTGWILGLSAAYLWRFLQGKWRTMSVIEQDQAKQPQV